MIILDKYVVISEYALQLVENFSFVHSHCELLCAYYLAFYSFLVMLSVSFYIGTVVCHATLMYLLDNKPQRLYISLMYLYLRYIK